MGEIGSNRTARLLAALTAAGASALLLASCAATPGGSTPAGVTTQVASASATPVESPSTPGASTSPTPTAVATTAAAKAAVKPFVTSATWDAKAGTLDVGAVVPKVVETGGTCTLTAVSGSQRVETSGAAVATASYTGCPQLVLARAKLGAGDWTVTVAYSSAGSAGVSDSRTVTVG